MLTESVGDGVGHMQLLHYTHLEPNFLCEASASARSSGDLNDVAFVEYTSGSTGNPKGVATVQFRTLTLSFSGRPQRPTSVSIPRADPVAIAERPAGIAHWTAWHVYHFPAPGSRLAYGAV